MPGKYFTWFVVFSYLSSNALPLNAQIFREAQAATPTTPPQAQPSPGAMPPVQPPVAPGQQGAVPPGEPPVAPESQGTTPPVKPPVVPGPQGAAPSQPSAPGRPPERTMLPPPTVASGGMVSLNFNRADLIEIIHILAQHLRLTYTIDPEVKGTVTINSSEPLRTEDLLPIFHQVLRMNGAVAVRAGNVYRIMPIKDGKGLARPMGSSREDSFALQIVPVRFFAVAEMKKVLTPFVMPGGEIIENPRGNFLVIMDLPSNIQRLMEIADLIDVQVFAGTRMEIYQPKVASAEELATEMTKVMQAFAASVPQAENFTAQFLALPRINQLLVISHSEAAWTYAKRWLDRIDVIAEGPGRRIFVYPVENGKADELAAVLSSALGLPAPPGAGQRRTLEDLHRSIPGGASQLGGRSQFGGGRSTTGMPGTSGSGFGGSGFGGSGFGTQQPFGAYAAAQVPTPPGQPAAPAPQPAPGLPVPPGLAPVPPSAAPRAPTPGAPGAPTAKPEEQLRIVADPATNSLIIYGTAQEFQNIKNILKELDAVPRQVLLDVLVAEITLNDRESLGFDYEILRKDGGVQIFDRTFGSRGGLLSGAQTGTTASSISGISQFPPGLTGIVWMSDVARAFINAIMSDSRVKILSSPSVLASDNRPARIQVGSEEPIATGQLTAATGAVTPSTSTTIQYRNTGRIVTIIPQVNSKGLVNLQALIEVSQRGPNVNVGGSTDSFPSFDLRQAETTAVVQDGDTLAIGGIIAENKEHRKTGIPYLINIPVLGQFFGTTTDTTIRTELIMLITPHVIRNRDEGTATTEELKSKLSALRNDLERMRLDRERDLEKMKRDWQEQQKPAVPTPSDEPPSPSPSSSPVRPESSVAPLRNINLSPERLPSIPPTHAPEISRGPASLLVSRVSAPQTAPTEKKVTEPVQQRKETPGPVALVVPKEQPRVATPATNSAREPSRRGAVWTVQVASLNQTRDAEGVAGKLKVKGYDSYVVAAEVKSKLWHRVRVGQGVDLSEAFELQTRLKDKENFDQAFIALR
jgi:general secretion pathway protein D